MKLQHQHGFTLIELMIVVAVMAILSAIAIPSYNEYMMRTRRADAKAGLRQAATWMEKGQTATGAYPTAAQFAATGMTTRGLYSITAASTATTYTLTAAPTVGSTQVGDVCGSFTLTGTGATNVTGSLSSAECWNR